jgi:hypothetical protein
MPKRSRHEALSCPSTVTVHDKTHVFWNCAQSMIFIAKLTGNSNARPIMKKAAYCGLLMKKLND